jgi:hypothetical protein
MATCRQVRTIAMSLPEALEKEHWGRPSFRVRDRIFATLNEAERRAVVKTGEPEQELIEASGVNTYDTGGFARLGWRGLELDGLSADMLRALIIAAWKRVATKRGLKAFAEGAPPRRERKAKRR